MFSVVHSQAAAAGIVDRMIKPVAAFAVLCAEQTCINEDHAKVCRFL